MTTADNFHCVYMRYLDTFIGQTIIITMHEHSGRVEVIQHTHHGSLFVRKVDLYQTLRYALTVFNQMGVKGRGWGVRLGRCEESVVRRLVYWQVERVSAPRRTPTYICVYMKPTVQVHCILASENLYE